MTSNSLTEKTSRAAGPRRWMGLGGLALLMLAGATPAQADYCIRLSGGSFSGDIGFFRFKGTRPNAVGTFTSVAGRAAGLSPVFGSAVISDDGTTLEIGATFFIDATQGQMDISFSPPLATNGSGYASYGVYGVNTSVTAKAVRCASEP